VTSLRLPLLEERRASLETCVYCPKLCRAACPVSNVEPVETLTPWGKMSLAYFAGRGDVPLDREHAAVAWACTGCHACRDRCDHKNDVAGTLLAARAEAFSHQAAPTSVLGVVAGFPERRSECARAVREIQPDELPAGTPALLIGCTYARHTPDVARDALFATERLAGGAKRAVRSCCGLPLLQAGDQEGFTKAARALAEELAGAPSLTVVDPGCARALLVEAPRFGVRLPPIEIFVDLAARVLARGAGALPKHERTATNGAVRWHDPCQLGRGLGRFEEPRAVLEAITGERPREFQRAREEAECSGGGSLVPVTRPRAARAMAEARVDAHRASGGGTLVTGCAQSLHRFRKAGEAAEDLVTLVARSLRS
jgi:Fe-S oxidoreductase